MQSRLRARSAPRDKCTIRHSFSQAREFFHDVCQNKWEPNFEAKLKTARNYSSHRPGLRNTSTRAASRGQTADFCHPHPPHPPEPCCSFQSRHSTLIAQRPPSFAENLWRLPNKKVKRHGGARAHAPSCLAPRKLGNPQKLNRQKWGRLREKRATSFCELSRTSVRIPQFCDLKVGAPARKGQLRFAS